MSMPEPDTLEDLDIELAESHDRERQHRASMQADSLRASVVIQTSTGVKVIKLFPEVE